MLSLKSSEAQPKVILMKMNKAMNMTAGGLILNLSATTYYGQEMRLRGEEKGDTVRDHYFSHARCCTLFFCLSV